MAGNTEKTVGNRQSVAGMSRASLRRVNGSESDARRQAVRFAVVGVINTTLDFSIFGTLRLLDVPVIPSNVASTTTGMAFSFFVNRRFVFSGAGASWKRQAVLFFLGTAFSMYVLQSLTIVGLLRILPAPAELAAVVAQWFNMRPASAMTLIRSVSAKLGATAVSLVWNFSFYRWVVFASSPARSRATARFDEHR